MDRSASQRNDAIVSVAIERITTPTDELRSLIDELDATLGAEYPPEQRHGLTLDRLFEPHVRFYIARLDGAAIGCGGIALFDGFAEVKRMFVRQAARGRGVAQAILARLEAEASASNRTVVRLETGTRQYAAMRLYEQAGYRKRDAFGPYAAMAPHEILGSVFYEKTLPT